MTRTTVLTALAASLIGTLCVSATAQAGGMRLGFGGPMASFVATPTHGGSSYRAPSNYGRGAKCAPKSSQPQVASVRHAEPKRAKVQQSEPRIARQEAKPVRETKVASVQREPTETVGKVISVDTVTSTAQAGASGSNALAQTDIAATTAAAVVATTPVVETAAPVATPVAALETPAIARVATVEPPVAVAETKAAAAQTLAEPAAVKKPEVKAVEAARNVGCKKFIPSVGVTIDVRCAK